MKDCIDILKYALWGEEPCDHNNYVNHETYNELKQQAIIALPANIISSLSMPEGLREEWKMEIIKQIVFFCKYKYMQTTLPISVPYVILKGTSIAKYYPQPEYRTMGDIDIITKREDYENACFSLLKNGFIENTSKKSKDFGRHRGFRKDGIEIEVHAFFSLFNDIERAEYLDNLIFQNITDTHVLPDMVNGLVVLVHIAQHLEKGIGLRHVVDWIMFVDKCINDENWIEIKTMIKKVGLENFAVVLTRMCELYLGLKPHKWCSDADDHTCWQLWEYIKESGNFGIKHAGDSNDSINAFFYARSPKAAFHLLQERGKANWKKLTNKSYLEPFAWLYQLIRYCIKGFKRDKAVTQIKKEYLTAREKGKLFDKLGVKQKSKGLAVFEEGKYIITNKMP